MIFILNKKKSLPVLQQIRTFFIIIILQKEI
jgi:hypothetical protein